MYIQHPQNILLVTRECSNASRYQAKTKRVSVFRIGKRFELTLLFQSIAMIITMLILLEIVVRYQHDQSFAVLYSELRSSFSSNSIEEDLRAEENGLGLQRHSLKRSWRMPFWSWDHYLDYINCLLAFTTIIAFLYLMLRQHSAFIEILGALSLGIESTLPLPQCISNFKQRSTSGFSLLVLASWVCVLLFAG